MTAEEIAALEREAVAARNALTKATDEQAKRSSELRAAVRRLRELGRSHGQIAALLEVSRGRAQQLSQVDDPRPDRRRKNSAARRASSASDGYTHEPYSEDP